MSSMSSIIRFWQQIFANAGERNPPRERWCRVFFNRLLVAFISAIIIVALSLFNTAIAAVFNPALVNKPSCENPTTVREQLIAEVPDAKFTEVDATSYLRLFDQLPPASVSPVPVRLMVAEAASKHAVMLLGFNAADCLFMRATLPKQQHEKIIADLSESI